MAEVSRSSPLAADAERLRSAGEVGLALAEIPFLVQFDVRADSREAGLVGQFQDATGIALPSEPNTVEGSSSLAALWLGPDEWLVLAADSLAAGGLSETRLAEVHERLTVVDVSAARTMIELSGPRARELLGAGCSIDLHPRSFASGSCAQTMIGRVNVILWQVTEEPRYCLLVGSSFARALALWLLDAVQGLEA